MQNRQNVRQNDLSPNPVFNTEFDAYSRLIPTLLDPPDPSALREEAREKHIRIGASKNVRKNVPSINKGIPNFDFKSDYECDLTKLFTLGTKRAAQEGSKDFRGRGKMIYERQ